MQKAQIKAHTSIQVQRKQSGLPCAVVYGLLRALPGDRAFLSPSSPRSLLLENLNASVEASGPHDFAVRVGAVRHGHFHVHRIPRPTSVTTAKRPSCGHETADIWTDLRFLKIRIFLEKGLDMGTRKHASDLPVGLLCRTHAPLTGGTTSRDGSGRGSHRLADLRIPCPVPGASRTQVGDRVRSEKCLPLGDMACAVVQRKCEARMRAAGPLQTPQQHPPCRSANAEMTIWLALFGALI
jgi:hypothetical protein